MIFCGSDDNIMLVDGRLTQHARYMEKGSDCTQFSVCPSLYLELSGHPTGFGSSLSSVCTAFL